MRFLSHDVMEGGTVSPFHDPSSTVTSPFFRFCFEDVMSDSLLHKLAKPRSLEPLLSVFRKCKYRGRNNRTILFPGTQRRWDRIPIASPFFETLGAAVQTGGGRAECLRHLLRAKL
jgi:hypothetical protein